MSLGENSKGTGEDSVLPKKLIDILHEFCVSKSIFTACELEIFDILYTAGGPLSTSKIAEQLSTNQDATSRLLDVLVSLELLVKQTEDKDEHAYSNTAMGTELLTKNSLSSFLEYVAFVRGCTGDLAYAACMVYPNMKITVLDLPPVVWNAPHFRPSMEECQNQHNVTFKAGDFFEPTLPAADLYELTHILHDWKKDRIDALLGNIFNNLHSGGGVLIGELLLYDDKSGPLLTQYWSLIMLNICDARERSGQEYKQLLEKHGFKDVQWKYTQTNSLDAVLAIKP